MPKCLMRITHRVLSFRWFVGLLTDLFMRRGFSPLHKRIASAFSRSHDSPSNDRFSPHAGCVLHGKQHFRNTATLGSLPRCLLTAEAASFRVRDSHPIPLFSEQACVSDCSGRAFATKAMLFSLLYARLFYAHKKTSPALLSCRQKKSRVLCIFGLIARKKYQAIRLVARTVPIIYIFIIIYYVRVHFLSKIYIPILPQSEVIVKWYFFRSCGRIFRCAWFLLSFVEFRRNTSEFSSG